VTIPICPAQAPSLTTTRLPSYCAQPENLPPVKACRVLAIQRILP